MHSLNWSNLVKKGRLMDALYLFACRLNWLRYGDPRALESLRSAAECADPDLRLIATTFLVECAHPAVAEHPTQQSTAK